jgi:glutathione synthase/RimK-type ligase-like ATP-grasp enzyme
MAAALTRARDPAAPRLAQDKLAFEAACRERGFPIVQSLVVIDKENHAPPPDLPAHDLILKPVDQGRGIGIEGWDYGDGQYRECKTGDRLSSPDLLRHASQLAQEYSTILIQRRIKNHPALAPFAGSALATTRIVTIFDEEGRPEIVDAFFRTSAEPNAVVDNFHSGGVIFPIDLASGTFRPGMKFKAWGPAKTTHHPQSGELVAGRVHPGWNEISDLARRLHVAFPSFAVIGWDVAYGEEGALITEANSTPEISVNRQGTMDGLGGTRLLGLVAFHAARWLLENEPPGSRWRPKRLEHALSTVGNRPETSVHANSGAGETTVVRTDGTSR